MKHHLYELHSIYTTLHGFYINECTEVNANTLKDIFKKVIKIKLLI